jgi:hypothetical protein
MLLGSVAALLVAQNGCGNGPVDSEVNDDFGFNPSTSGGGMTNGTCGLYEHQAVALPVNLYIMFDRSSSMLGAKWDSATTGLKAFVADPHSAGLRVGLRFFPRPADSTPVCDQYAYAEPEVPFGELPGNQAALEAAIDAASADGFGTPMYPALGGAILKGIELATANPDEVSAVLLVTDGQPQGPASSCGGVNPEDPAEVAKLAASGAAFSPPVATYVVGLPGADQTSANLIAAAGGTDEAILVAASDVEKQFREALGKVRGDVLPCRYELPAEIIDGEITLSEVNIEIKPSDGEPYIVPRNDDCDGAGWHYEGDGANVEIVLCKETCDALKADDGAAIRVLLGCATQLK